MTSFRYLAIAELLLSYKLLINLKSKIKNVYLNDTIRLCFTEQSMINVFKHCLLINSPLLVGEVDTDIRPSLRQGTK